MITPDGESRLRRIKIWILCLSLIPAVTSLALSSGDYAAGFFLGGILILLNFMGTERAIRSFVAGGGTWRTLIAFLQFLKLGITGAVIALILYWNVASPIAMILGLSALPTGLMFDIFFFPVNK